MSTFLLSCVLGLCFGLLWAIFCHLVGIPFWGPLHIAGLVVTGLTGGAIGILVGTQE